MASIQSFTKQPSERLDYDVDYELFFEESDTDEIAAVISVEVSGTGVAPELVIDGPGLPIGDPTRRVKVWLTDGENGETYKVTVIAETDAGRIVEQDFNVKIKEK